MSPKNGSVEAAPPPARERLAGLQRELAEITTALEVARTALRAGSGNVDAVVQAQTRAEVLRQAMADVEREAEQEAAVQRRAEAQRLVTTRAREYSEALAQLDSLGTAAGKAVAAACAVVKREGEMRRQAAVALREVELLGLRWPGEVDVPELAPSPPAVDFAEPVLEALGTRSPGPARPLVVPHSASDSAEERRRAGLKTAARYFERHSGELSPEVRQLLEAAGFPDLETAQERAIRDAREAQQAREARELERFGAEVPRSLERRGL